MVLIIEERPDHLADLKKDFESKKDIVIVATRIAGFIRLNQPGQDYQTVFCNGKQVIGEKAVIMEMLNIEKDFQL